MTSSIGASNGAPTLFHMSNPPSATEPAPGVPVVVLTQFLAALRAKDFTGAKVLAFRSASPHTASTPEA